MAAIEALSTWDLYHAIDAPIGGRATLAGTGTAPAATDGIAGPTLYFPAALDEDLILRHTSSTGIVLDVSGFTIEVTGIDFALMDLTGTAELVGPASSASGGLGVALRVLSNRKLQLVTYDGASFQSHTTTAAANLATTGVRVTFDGADYIFDQYVEGLWSELDTVASLGDTPGDFLGYCVVGSNVNASLRYRGTVSGVRILDAAGNVTVELTADHIAAAAPYADEFPINRGHAERRATAGQAPRLAIINDLSRHSGWTERDDGDEGTLAVEGPAIFVANPNTGVEADTNGLKIDRTPAADPSFDYRATVLRPLDDSVSPRFINGKVFIRFLSGGSLYAFFRDDVSGFPNLVSTQAELDAAALPGEWLDVRYRWDATIDRHYLYARAHVTGRPLTDLTDFVEVASATHEGRTLFPGSYTERYGQGDSWNTGYTGGYREVYADMGGDVLHIKPRDIDQWAADDQAAATVVTNDGNDPTHTLTVARATDDADIAYVPSVRRWIFNTDDDDTDNKIVLPVVGTDGGYTPNDADECGITLPDETALDIIGDLELVLAFDEWDYASDNANVIAKYRAAGTRSYRIISDSGGHPYLQWSTDGTAESFADSLQAVPADVRWLKVEFDVDNGSTQHVATFLTHTADPLGPEPLGGWTTLATITQAGVTSIAATTEPLTIGNFAGGSAASMTEAWSGGNLRRAIVRDGIGGTTVAEITPDDFAKANALGLTADTDTFTVHTGQTATVIGDVNTFTGTHPWQTAAAANTLVAWRGRIGNAPGADTPILDAGALKLRLWRSSSALISAQFGDGTTSATTPTISSTSTRTTEPVTAFIEADRTNGLRCILVEADGTLTAVGPASLTGVDESSIDAVTLMTSIPAATEAIAITHPTTFPTNAEYQAIAAGFTATEPGEQTVTWADVDRTVTWG